MDNELVEFKVTLRFHKDKVKIKYPDTLLNDSVCCTKYRIDHRAVYFCKNYYSFLVTSNEEEVWLPLGTKVETEGYLKGEIDCLKAMFPDAKTRHFKSGAILMTITFKGKKEY